MLYRGVANAIRVAVPGVPCNSVSLSSTSGRVEKGSVCPFFSITRGQVRQLTLHVSWTDSAANMHTDSLHFSVKELPIRAYFAGLNHEDDSLRTNAAAAAIGVIARVEGGGFDLKLQVTGYRLMLERAHQWVFDGTSSEAKLTDAMREALRSCGPGDMLYVQQITVKMPDLSVRTIEDLRFVLY
ncbi:MAG: hypothetical protein KA352_02330 [Flavobacteriales bacterium]|nr:hypothetical protein [Flavobacteriales bacterium]